ncbi:phosphoglycerate kinase [Candidatus Micrarchaeota archaeon]|nr:phosphoglycerate kinase [Candidatus Micrarchaeota archaeon]
MEKKQFFTLDDFNFKGKTTLVRVDINAPFDAKTGLQDSKRFAEHAITLKELSKKGARVVVLAHQGRPFSTDFISLKTHASYLEKHVNRPVRFLDGLFSNTVLNEIRQMNDGDIVLLENTRFYSEETEKVPREDQFLKALMVKRLCSIADFYVNDAFSASHRMQASLVGPAFLLPSAAGRVMERELAGLSKALETAEHPNVYVLGGAKPDDVFTLLQFACSSKAVDKILTSGVLGELCLLAKGYDIGPTKRQWIRDAGYDALLPELQSLMEKHSSKIEFPQDVAIGENGARKEFRVTDLAQANGPTYDIGAKTIARYQSILSTAKTIYFKGPVGKFEDPLFEQGTREILKAVSSSKAFSLMGGGHSLAAMEKFSIPSSKISHLSLAGGAVVSYLQGKKLPGVEALKQAFRKTQK